MREDQGLCGGETKLRVEEIAAPNERLVANLMESLDTAYNSLVDSHVAYMLKTGSDLTEAMHVQYNDKNEDNHDDVKNIAMLIVGERDE